MLSLAGVGFQFSVRLMMPQVPAWVGTYSNSTVVNLKIDASFFVHCYKPGMHLQESSISRGFPLRQSKCIPPFSVAILQILKVLCFKKSGRIEGERVYY